MSARTTAFTQFSRLQGKIGLVESQVIIHTGFDLWCLLRKKEPAPQSMTFLHFEVIQVNTHFTQE